MNMGIGLILDIVIVLVLGLSVLAGARKGFARTLVSFFQWVVCIVVALLFTNKLKSFLSANTQLDENINRGIYKHLQESSSDGTSIWSVPRVFSQDVSTASDGISYDVAVSITSVIMTIISFLLIIVIIKLVGYILIKIFSKKHHDGAIGGFDGFMGFLLGILRGLIVSCVLLAIMVPLCNLLWPSLTSALLKGLDDSMIAGFIYHNNFLLFLLRDFSL